MTTDRLYRYELVCTGGFEDVLIDEVRGRLGKRAQSLQPERGEVGRLFLTYEGSPRHLLELECAAGIAAVVTEMHDVTVGRPGLDRIVQGLASIPLAAMERLARVADDGVTAGEFSLQVSQRGSHRFTTSETERAVTEGLQRLGLATGPRGMSLQVRLQKRRAQLKLVLKAPDLGAAVERRGMPPAMVSAIVTLLGLEDTDDLLIVAGRHDAAAAAQRVCGARSISVGDRGQAQIAAAPARLPILPGVMTTALAVGAGDPEQTRRILQEASGAVAEEGVIAILVPRAESFAAHLGGWGLPLEVMGALPVFIRRQRWALFLLGRLALLQLDPIRHEVCDNDG